MRHGPVRSLIKNDALLRRLAAKLLSRVGHAENHKPYIRGRLRKVARVVWHVRQSSKDLTNTDLKSLLVPRHFRTVLTAVRAVCGYNSDQHQYRILAV